MTSVNLFLTNVRDLNNFIRVEDGRTSVKLFLRYRAPSGVTITLFCVKIGKVLVSKLVSQDNTNETNIHDLTNFIPTLPVILK